MFILAYNKEAKSCWSPLENRHLIGWPSLGQLQSKVCFLSWILNMFPNHLHIIRPLFYLFLWCSNKYVLYYMYCCIYKVQLCKKCWIPHDDNDSEISFQVWFLLPHCLWTFSGPNTAQEKSSFFFLSLFSFFFSWNLIYHSGETVVPLFFLQKMLANRHLFLSFCHTTDSIIWHSELPKKCQKWKSRKVSFA